MWDFFIEKRRFTYLLILALLAFGAYSVAVIPKESAPEVQVPVGIITTILPGAPAAEVESLVTNELERGLSGSLSRVKKITSTSREGVSSVVVEFTAEADIDESIADLKDKVDQIKPELPDEAEEPQVSEVSFVDQPILTIAFSGDKSETEFTALAKLLENEIEKVSGVSKVESSGVRDQEVTVLVDKVALEQFSLTILDVTNSLRSVGSTLPIGQIVTDNIAYNLILDDGIEQLETIKNLAVGSKGRQPIRLREVAKVEIGLSPANTYSRLSLDGNPSAPAFQLNIFKQRGGDITKLTTNIHDTITRLQNENRLPGISTYTIQDAGEEIKKDLNGLTFSGIQTVFLVVIVLMLAIGWREGLIAGLAIPLSFTIGFIGLYLSGNTINFISLFALILGIGVLVDSGIVIVEGMNRRMSERPDESKFQVAKDVVREFATPLISGTLTTVAMFVGLFIVSGVTGQFIAGIPFTLIFILFASLLVALGFLPLITAKLVRTHEASELEKEQNRLNQRLFDWYKGFIGRMIESRQKQKRFLILLTVGFISAILLIPLGLVRVIFFESSDMEFLFVEVTAPEGTTKERTDLLVRAVEEELYKETDMIEAFATTVGGASLFTSGATGGKLANIFVALKDDRPLTSQEFTKKLRDDFAGFAGAEVTIVEPDEGPPTGAPISVKLFGENLETLNTASLAVLQELKAMNDVANASASNDDSSNEFVLALEHDKIAAYGLNPRVISETARSMIYGSTVATVTNLDQAIDIVVRQNLNPTEVNIERANYTTIDEVLRATITTPQGLTIPLSDLVTLSLREANNAVVHENGKRVMTVSADLGEGGNVMDINTRLEKLINDKKLLPSDVSFSLGGETEESDQAFMEMVLALVIGILLMVAILVIQFDSYRHTYYVLSIIPFSLIGIFYGLAITGSTLSFPSMMGFIALTGIVVNNSILLIDMMNNLRRTEPDLAIPEVVVKASTERLRPILLTSLTTIMGMVPLLFTDELWIPLATAVIFGLIFSVVITLILVPVLYSRKPGAID